MKKRISYLLVLFLIAIILPLNVFGAEKINLKVDKTDLEVGDEITVSAIVPSDLSTYAMLATLKYDQNVFQKIDDSNFSLADSASISYNGANNKFGIINKTGKIEGTIFTIHLKVKEDANVGYTNIALTNISSSDGSTKTEFPMTSTKVFISRDAKEGESIPNNQENEIIEDNETVITASTNIPIIIILASLTAISFLISIYILIKNKKVKKSFCFLTLLEIVLIVIIMLLFMVNSNKKDVNKDGVKDYTDAEEIIKYLINIEGTKDNDKKDDNVASNDNNVNSNDDNNEDDTTNNNIDNDKNDKPENRPGGGLPTEDFDTNNDGKVDIDDAGHITEDTTKKSKVQLKEENPDKVAYIAKGDITFNFTAEINPKDAKIKKVRIGDEYYDVTLNGDTYSVILKDINKAGNYEFTITEVLLDNDQKVETKLKITREVLKDIPYVNKFNLNDEKGLLSFELVDEDAAFLNGTVTIYDGEDKLTDAVVEKTKTTVSFKAEEDKDYYVEIIGSYDLDSKTNDKKNNYDDKTMFEQSFTIGGDYNFTLTNASITDIIKEGETPIVSFNSTNNRDAVVMNANLTIQNSSKEYNISTRDKDKYEIALIGADTTPGEHKVTLDNVGLNSLKTFYNNEDYKANELTYTVLKNIPTIKDLELTDDHSSKKVNAKFNIEDTDDAINKLVVVLIDSAGKIVTQQEINKENISEKNINVSLSYEKSLDGFYTVKVLADYDLTDKYKYTNKSLGEETILTTTPEDIYISSMTINSNNNYPTKNQKDYGVTFVVHVGDTVKAVAKKYGENKEYNTLSTITINGLNYSVSGLSGSTSTDYKVSANLIVPNDAGIFDIKANRVQLSISGYYNMTKADMFSVKENKLTIDVLKDKPKVENLIITDDYEKDEATFNFDVTLDETEQSEKFTDGLIKLGSNTHSIAAGHNKVTFTGIDKDKNLDLIFTGSYDLDTDTLPETSDKNEFKNAELLKTVYGLYSNDDYQNIAIENAKVISDNADSYFEKNEKIKLSFGIGGIEEKLGAVPEKVIIDDSEYTLTKTGEEYELILDGYHSSGEKEITITDIILTNGKKITLEDSYTFKPEVLKDTITINDFTYKEQDKQIKINFDLKDPDNSLVGKAKIIIIDENGNTIYENDYNKEIIFDKNECLRYYVKVIADYDRDIDTKEDSDNHYKEVTLLDEIVSLEKNNIELKNIIDINLYETEAINGEEVNSLKDIINIDELQNNLNKYFVEIKMENMPNTRAKIQKIIEKDNKLILVLEYEYVTEEKTESQVIRITFGSIEERTAKNEVHPEDALNNLIADLKANKNITLEQNYDFSLLETNADNAYITSDYSGTLNGNGYTLKNLSKPLFNQITNGTIENLRLKDITLTSNGHGGLANVTNKGVIKDIIVENITKSSADSDNNGGLIGAATNGTTIVDCGVKNINFEVGDKQQEGGLVGRLENSSIDNSYATGKIGGWYNFRASFVGNVQNGTITNSLAKVTVSNSYISCDFACSYGNKGKYVNNVTLTDGSSNGMISGTLENSSNNYYLTSKAIILDSSITKINKEDITDEFFADEVGLSKEVWVLDNTSYDETPILQIEKTSSLSDTSSEKYDEAKETLYANLLKLMPYYDSNKIIEMADNITDDLLLNEPLVHIAPVDKNGNLVTYLTTDNQKKISKIKLVFKNGKKEEFNVTYDKTYDMIATYRINSLNIDYSYNNYVIDSTSQVVTNLTNYLKGLDYTNNLDTLTTNDDSRIYRDFYNETTKNELKEFVLKYLSNSDYTNTMNDPAINNYIEREVKKDKKIEKALYVYNYFRRFYDLDIDGMKVYDFILFNMHGFDKDLTTTKIINLFLADSTGANFNTNITNGTYNKIFSNYTNLKNISSFLEYIVTHFSNNEMAAWIRSQFKGILVEIPVIGHEKDIQYTLWDHFSNEDAKYNGDGYKVYNYILPILTLPKTAAYIISAPAQFTIGAQRVYMGNPEDATELTNFKAKMKVYTDRISSYYNTAYAILEDAKLFNDIHLYQIDKRTTKNENGASIYNSPYSTNEPFHKNFDEVVNLWPANYGVNAGNWGDRIEWNVAGFMDSTLKTDGTIDDGHPTWATWSHESAHYLDSRLFLKDNGRRYDAGGEDYADEFLMQKFSSSGIVMNLSIKYKDNLEVATNLTPERINSKAKIKDFYSKMFETIYIVDYIEAQAFLKLTPEEKAEIGIQVSYPNETKYTAPGNLYRARLVSGFSQLTTEQWSKIELKDINDLIENKVMIYPGVYKYSSRGDNSYGGEGINVAHWYQPNNPAGRPDSYALKWFSYEMLGYAGYDKGFVEYASNINPTSYEQNKELDDSSKGTTKVNNYKTDAMAIKRITNYSTMDEYKKARFEQTKNKLEYLSYVNVDEYAQELYEALVQDAKEMKEAVQRRINNKGSEEACLKDYWCYTPLFGQDRGYPNSTEVRRKLYFAIKNATNDFTEDIYSNTIKQTVTFDIKTHE